jgi:uncharacterized protein involved in exopolysaccharide biosynthesis
VLPGRKYTPEDIAALAWRRKWLIVIAICAVTTVAITFALRLPDIYRSQTLILVIAQRVPDRYVSSTVTTRIEDRLRSLRQQILSHTRLERVIRDFDLYEEELQVRPLEQVIDEMRGVHPRGRVRGDHAGRGAHPQGGARRRRPRSRHRPRQARLTDHR